MTCTLDLVRDDLRAFLDVLPIRDWAAKHIGAMRQMLGMMPVAESSAEMALKRRLICGPAIAFQCLVYPSCFQAADDTRAHRRIRAT